MSIEPTETATFLVGDPGMDEIVAVGARQEWWGPQSQTAGMTCWHESFTPTTDCQGERLRLEGWHDGSPFFPLFFQFVGNSLRAVGWLPSGKLLAAVFLWTVLVQRSHTLRLRVLGLDRRRAGR